MNKSTPTIQKIFGTVVVGALLLGVYYLGRNVGESSSNEPSPTGTPSSTVTPIPSPTSSVSPTVTGSYIVPTPTKYLIDGYAFEFMVNVVGVSYEPNNDEYAGFRTCDSVNSTCTVYGVRYDYLAKFFEGAEYTLYYNTTGVCGVAAGTTYCDIDAKDATDIFVAPR